ncbi:hypothetical protein NHX12_000767 [Muraenolepis orangiensis]|uniref:E3 ubiquitin-protein ligase n=1 Tax=Muraenolepis orangiensis TaxID=630683 RepID=A0A9Q0DZF9_9TELE|nr:hypothetical protein NHX12_000767 [Muraenolepis orangiensis]
MASCGEVDHSMTSLPSSRKGGGGGGGGSGNGGGGESSCSASGGSAPTPPTVPECAICLQSCVHPVRLPCRHVFCFLCVKGASWQSKRCALCRQEVPEDFLERPTLLSPEELKASAGGRGGAAGDHAWYYEGRNGWWQYDERTRRELEDAFSEGRKTAEMLIAGFLYVADLENMVQYRRNEHGRRRKMKRDVVDIPKKGVAGLRLDAEGGSAGRQSSADGADTAVASASTLAIAASAPPIRGSSSLVDTLAQLRISSRPEPPRERAESGEEEEDDEEEEEEAPSSDRPVSVDESGSADWSEEEEDEDDAGEEEAAAEEGRDGEQVEAWGLRLRSHRLSPEDRAPPGAEASASPPSSAGGGGRSRMPDGQCTVTEV